MEFELFKSKKEKEANEKTEEKKKTIIEQKKD
jgi:hypothetical protein